MWHRSGPWQHSPTLLFGYGPSATGALPVKAGQSQMSGNKQLMLRSLKELEFIGSMANGREIEPGSQGKAAGIYTIEATTYSPGVTGNFTLTVSDW